MNCLRVLVRFLGAHWPEIIERICTLDPRPPRQLDESIPKDLERICLKALSKRASDRYSTAFDMVEDLRQWLQPTRPVQTVPTIPVGMGFDKKQLRQDLFRPPEFTDQVPRARLFATLSDLLMKCPVVSVEGLAGSGKTYLVASYVRSQPGSFDLDHVLWHDPQDNESTDDLLSHLELLFPLASRSTVSKAKEVFALLQKHNGLLVIDDFHRVNSSSYATLIQLATGYGCPSRVVLIGQTYVDFVGSRRRLPT